MQGWKQQEEARRSVGGGRNWILRKRARRALLLSEFQERVLFFFLFLFAKLESLTIRMLDFLQSFSLNSSVIFLESQGHLVPLQIPLILFLEPCCPQCDTPQR